MNYDEMRRRGMKWGKVHGYFGVIGGWIYHEKRDGPVCHGWAKLYSLRNLTIDAWIEDREKS